MNVRINSKVFPINSECIDIYGRVIAAMHHDSIRGFRKLVSGSDERSEQYNKYFVYKFDNITAMVFQRKFSNKNEYFDRPILIGYEGKSESDQLFEVSLWANSSAGHLSQSTPYARGYREGMMYAKEVVGEMLSRQ